MHYQGAASTFLARKGHAHEYISKPCVFWLKNRLYHSQFPLCVKNGRLLRQPGQKYFLPPNRPRSRHNSWHNHRVFCGARRGVVTRKEASIFCIAIDRIFALSSLEGSELFIVGAPRPGRRHTTPRARCLYACHRPARCTSCGEGGRRPYPPPNAGVPAWSGDHKSGARWQAPCRTCGWRRGPRTVNLDYRTAQAVGHASPLGAYVSCSRPSHACRSASSRGRPPSYSSMAARSSDTSQASSTALPTHNECHGARPCRTWGTSTHDVHGEHNRLCHRARPRPEARSAFIGGQDLGPCSRKSWGRVPPYCRATSRGRPGTAADALSIVYPRHSPRIGPSAELR